MFKKKKEEFNQSMVMTPDFGQEEQQQPYMQPIQQPQVQQYTQPMQSNQQFQPSIQVQPIQPAQIQQQRFQSKAIIIQGALTEEGYRYVVDTNYPLAVGECQLVQ